MEEKIKTQLFDVTNKEQVKPIIKLGFLGLVEASKLSVEDNFMQHIPVGMAEARFKKELERTINSGLSDFWHPIMDPSEKDGNIYFQEGERPALNHTYEWWDKKAEEFMPEYGFRLGTKTEYIAFLGCLIKQLVNSGYSVNKAWHEVCNDSENLGNYYHPRSEIMHTGSNTVCGWSDLANISKIVKNNQKEMDMSMFFRVSGNYFEVSHLNPLAKIERHYNFEKFSYFMVGWLVCN